MGVALLGLGFSGVAWLRFTARRPPLTAAA